MTIHHDKMAYGKLSPVEENFSEAQLVAMVRSLESQPLDEEDAKIVASADPRKGTFAKEQATKK